MKNTDILSRITALLNRSVKLAQQQLEDGSIIEAESFEVGADVYLVDGENKTPLAVGSYVLADGTTLEVTEAGKIGELATPQAEVSEEEMAEEVAPADSPLDENTEKDMAEVPATLEEILAAVVEAMQPQIDDLNAKIEALSGSQTEMKETLSSAVVSKPTVHKPTEAKLSDIKAAKNKSNTEARIFAMLSK